MPLSVVRVLRNTAFMFWLLAIVLLAGTTSQVKADDTHRNSSRAGALFRQNQAKQRAIAQRSTGQRQTFKKSQPPRFRKPQARVEHHANLGAGNRIGAQNSRKKEQFRTPSKIKPWANLGRKPSNSVSRTNSSAQKSQARRQKEQKHFRAMRKETLSHTVGKGVKEKARRVEKLLTTKAARKAQWSVPKKGMLVYRVFDNKGKSDKDHVAWKWGGSWTPVNPKHIKNWDNPKRGVAKLMGISPREKTKKGVRGNSATHVQIARIKDPSIFNARFGRVSFTHRERSGGLREFNVRREAALKYRNDRKKYLTRVKTIKLSKPISWEWAEGNANALV